MSIIAFDYDNTITADVRFWTLVIKMAEVCGHSPIIVSARPNSMDWGEIKVFGTNLGIPVYLTDLMGKREFMARQKIVVDIWVDDYPESICRDDAYKG